jgi:thioredoxin reductase (NADPH)
MTALSPPNEATPTLAVEEWVRLTGYAQPAQAVPEGTWLHRPGDQVVDMILVEQGEVQVTRPAAPGEQHCAVVVTFGPRQFSGELNLLTGQTGYLGARAGADTVVRRLPPSALREVMEQEPEISDLLLRTMIARREFLRTGDAARSLELVGGGMSADALALRTYAARQQLPHTWTDADSPAGAALLRAVGAQPADLPVAITTREVLLRATPGVLAEHLGLSYRPPAGQHTMDLVVVGAGPAGLAAAVYGASEGLETLVLESSAAGGQAAASSRIENYLGFTSGISGGELTAAAAVQAEKFGARIASPCPVARLHADEDGDVIGLTLDDGTEVAARAVVVATGARYRALPLERWSDFEGAGIYYAATEIEARNCVDRPVGVVGGANSAGQAALYLAERGSEVSLVVRGPDLRAKMSAYLADRIMAHPRITVHTGTEVAALHGSDRLEAISLRDGAGAGNDGTGGGRTAEQQPCLGLFCFIGAAPATEWLHGLAVDEKGFLRTDAQLRDEELAGPWPGLGRRPLPLETSEPRVFAAGDVRSGSMKRVAAAVGEGATAVSSVHVALGRLRV